VAEDSGLIVALGRWILGTACEQLVTWAGHPLTAKLKLSVNVSAREFRHPDFVRAICDVLAATKADPRFLVLELTESVVVDDIEIVIAKMTALREIGVGFSLDDFGTGYSSLSYLKRLPLNQLKIDQSFVRDVLVDTNDAVIARTIIALGQSLSLDVIAEGVETQAQREFLATHGCRSFQGYLFSAALPAEAFLAFVEAGLASSEKRVLAFFDADRRRRTVSGDNDRRILIGEQFATNARDDVFQRRAAEVPAADGTCEERIAGE